MVVWVGKTLEPIAQLHAMVRGCLTHHFVGSSNVVTWGAESRLVTSHNCRRISGTHHDVTGLGLLFMFVISGLSFVGSCIGGISAPYTSDMNDIRTTNACPIQFPCYAPENPNANANAEQQKEKQR
jgi:hypothetical protein